MGAVPASVTRLAAGQFGLVTMDQCLAAGVRQSTLGGWVRRGWLVRVQPKVYRIAGAPVTFEQRLLAAVFAAGPRAAASHRAAAWLWGLVDDAPVEVVVPTGRSARLRSAVVHHTRDPIVLSRRRGIPTTTPMRALVDLGAVEDDAGRIEEALDRGLVAGLYPVAAVEWELARLARPGRRGAGRLQQVLDRRALDDRPPDGLLEPRFARLLRRHGLPPAAFQHGVAWRGRRYRIDFAYPDRSIAIEVDGYEKRSTREAFQADTERQTALAALGWTVLRVTWRDVVRRPAYVAATVATATR
ncbi:MAG TPA: DUF559 domain-containing protein [Acidimicrobiales bacterium]|nr:DUF559 domain-containing protein [Acidimicrobiales bacterium]